MQKCNEILSIIRSAESGITDQNIYKLEENNSVPQLNISVDDLIDGKIDFYDRAYQLNEALRKGKKREAFNISREFYAICRSAENIVNEEIITLRSLIIQNREALQKTYTNEIDRLNQVTYKEWESEQEVLKNTVDKYVKQKEISNIKSKDVSTNCINTRQRNLEEISKKFCKQFSPQEFLEEYIKLYSAEPLFENYKCCKEMPQKVHIATLEYDISNLKLNDYTKEFLKKFYYFMYKGNKICIPYTTAFDKDFNYLFRFSGEDALEL